ncbi:MAG: hypothetical protein K6E83_09460, partial [Clostridium sp.]|nr:hypothetical protein [Clostridium sp.]
PPQYQQMPPQYQQAPPPVKKGPGPLLPVIAGIILVLAVAGAGFFLLGGKGKNEDKKASAKQETTKTEGKKEEKPEKTREETTDAREEAAAETARETAAETVAETPVETAADTPAETTADVLADIPRVDLDDILSGRETGGIPGGSGGAPEGGLGGGTGTVPGETAFVDEYVLTEEDYRGFAKRLSTTENAAATEFEWALDYINHDGTGAGQVLSAPDVYRVTDDLQPLLNGGWKAFMFTKDGEYGGEMERYFNADITTEGDSFIITLNFAYIWDPSAGQTFPEEGEDTLKGTFNRAAGTAEARSAYDRIEFDAFYFTADMETEYALGSFYWPSGEKERIALMRGVGY